MQFLRRLFGRRAEPQAANRRIARGGFGSVRKGILDNTPVAIKTVRNNDSFENELKCLKDLFQNEEGRRGQGNIVRLLHFEGNNGNGGAIYLELAEESLYDVVLNNIIFYDECTALKWALDIAYGIAFMHSNYYMHRDIKLKNLLLYSDPDRGTVKLCDFGDACIGPSCDGKVGSLVYSAPEIHYPQYRTRPDRCYGESCDVYSWSLAFWEILSKCEVFTIESGTSTREQNEYLFGIKIKNGWQPKKLDIDRELQQIIDDCSARDPLHRPSMGLVARRLRIFYEKKFLTTEDIKGRTREKRKQRKREYFSAHDITKGPKHSQYKPSNCKQPDRSPHNSVQPAIRKEASRNEPDELTKTTNVFGKHEVSNPIPIPAKVKAGGRKSRYSSASKKTSSGSVDSRGFLKRLDKFGLIKKLSNRRRSTNKSGDGQFSPGGLTLYNWSYVSGHRSARANEHVNVTNQEFSTSVSYSVAQDKVKSETDVKTAEMAQGSTKRRGYVNIGITTRGREFQRSDANTIPQSRVLRSAPAAYTDEYCAFADIYADLTQFRAQGFGSDTRTWQG